MMNLTLKEFKEVFEYEYSNLDINLEKSKDGDSGERLIIIKDLRDINKIVNAIKSKSYTEGCISASCKILN